MKTLTKISIVFSLVLVLFVFANNSVFAKVAQEYDKNLITLLADENIGIRTSAAQILGERKIDDAVDPLIQMLENESNYSARIVAAMSLYQIGDVKALPFMKKVAKNDENKTVRRVVSALVVKMEKTEFVMN